MPVDLLLNSWGYLLVGTLNRFYPQVHWDCGNTLERVQTLFLLIVPWDRLKVRLVPQSIPTHAQTLVHKKPNRPEQKSTPNRTQSLKPTMASEVPRNMSFEQAHNERWDREIRELQEGIRKVITLLEEEQGRGRQRECQRQVETHNNESSGAESHTLQRSQTPPRGRNRRSRDDGNDFKDVKVEPPEFHGSSNPRDFLEWVQT